MFTGMLIVALAVQYAMAGRVPVHVDIRDARVHVGGYC